MFLFLSLSVTRLNDKVSESVGVYGNGLASLDSGMFIDVHPHSNLSLQLWA